MRRFALVASQALILSCAAYAAVPSDASLKGTYALQMTQVQEVSWGKSVSATCFGVTYTQFLGGQTAATRVTAGTVKFSGAGTFSMSTTQNGGFNQAASNSTVTISCTSNPKSPYTTNAGYPVFLPAATSTVTGTYSVASSATGTMVFADSDPDEVVDISLGQFSTSGVAGVVLIRQVLKNNGDYSTGIAVLN
jgi:hypothetical protein